MDISKKKDIFRRGLDNNESRNSLLDRVSKKESEPYVFLYILKVTIESNRQHALREIVLNLGPTQHFFHFKHGHLY